MTSSRTAARLAAVFGLLALAAIPVAAGSAQFLAGLGLLQAIYIGVPVSVALALVAVVFARRARLARAMAIKEGTVGPVRFGRFLAFAGLYAGTTGALALAVYAVLRLSQ